MITRTKVVCGDAVEVLKEARADSFALTVTSPPYFRHRDYGAEGQFGQEASLGAYLDRIGQVLVEILRVTDDAGSCFFVVGDTYLNRKLLLVPHRIALLASDLGWTVRNDLIWRKTSPPPESPKNRWRSGHEHILFLTKRESGYRFNPEAVRVPYSQATLHRWGAGQSYGGAKSAGRRKNKDSRLRHGQVFCLHPGGCLPIDVWELPSANTSAAHYAAFPARMVRTIVETCSEPGDLVLDPFAGSGTTCVVAEELGRLGFGIELNLEYAKSAAAAVEAVASAHAA